MPLVTHILTKRMAHTLYMYSTCILCVGITAHCCTCAAHVQHVLNKHASDTVGIDFITVWLAMSSSCHIIHARFILDQSSVMNWTGKGRQH